MARVVALSGGVGGSKLVTGLACHVRGDELLVIANTGDDFEHLGLHVSPDIDTVIYTSTGRNNKELGWGQAGETWSFMAMLQELGGPDWFNLGDRDLALHVWRTHLLASGHTLSDVTEMLASACGVPFRLRPMSDQPVRTMVETRTHGHLPMQNYFVEHKCAPAVAGLNYKGAEVAVPAPGLIDSLTQPDLEAIIICPSNPFLSIDPLLAVPGIRHALSTATAPVVAVSPIVGGAAIKGPTAKMMAELGLEVSALSVCRHYADIIDIFVLDDVDAALAADVAAIGVRPVIAPTIMNDDHSKATLAARCLQAARSFEAVD